MERCVSEIKDAAKTVGHNITDDEAADILDAFASELERQRGKVYSQSQEDALLERRVKIHQQAKISAAIQKRNYLINRKREAAIDAQVARYERDNLGNAENALLDMLVGGFKNFSAARRSVDTRRQGILNDAAGSLLAALKKDEDLLDLLRSGELDGMIYIELFDGMEKSKNAKAQKIASAIKRVQKNLLDRKNRNGANIGELADYVVRQRHNPDLLRDAGYEKWKADILPLLDQSRTFEGVRTGGADEFLKEAYEHLVTGNFQKVSSVFGNDGRVDPLTAFKGPSNLAKKLSGSRVLHFKDGKSSHAYAQKYAGKDLITSVLDSFANDAESISLMEVLGTNPQAMVERAIEKHSLSDRGKRRVLNALKELDGTTRAVGGNQKTLLGLDMATASASLRALQNMSKLGMATISSFSDVASKAALLQRETGRTWLQSYNEAILDVLRAFNDPQKQEFAYLLGTGTDAYMGSIHSRFGADDQLSGKMSKLQQLYFKLNGMQFWNAAQKDGVAKILSADLAMNSKKPYEELPQSVRNTLDMYGIGSDDLRLLSRVDQKGPDGKNYIFPEMVNQLSPSQIDPIINKRTGRLDITDAMRQEFLDDFRTRISAYYADSADAAVPTPGARERAIMNQGLLRGTPTGEAIRMLMQFKSFPITFVTKGLMRQYYGKKAAGNSGVAGVVQLMMGATAMGYISNATKDMLKGREPREIFTEERAYSGFVEAFTAGGGAGIYGDFLFGEYNRYGQSFVQSLAGPTFGAVDDIASMYGKMMDGNLDKAGEQAIQTAFRNVPGANLFYAKAAIDYLFLFGISEAMNPGYMSRMEKRYQKNYGSEFFLPPTSYGGGIAEAVGGL